MSSDKLVSFQKKEIQEIENANSVDVLPEILVRKIHKRKPEGVILYKHRDEIMAAYSYVIASRSDYRNESVAVFSNLKIHNENQYNVNYLILLLSEIITVQVSIKELGKAKQ